MFSQSSAAVGWQMRGAFSRKPDDFDDVLVAPSSLTAADVDDNEGPTPLQREALRPRIADKRVAMTNDTTASGTINSSMNASRAELHKPERSSDDRERMLFRLQSLERLANRQQEHIVRQARIAEQQAAEVLALRTSTSWAFTRPLRFLSKALSALRKGPDYWRHLYRVRAQVRKNWRRENPTLLVPPSLGPEVDHEPDLPSQPFAAEAVDRSIESLVRSTQCSSRVSNALHRALITGSVR